MEINIRQEVQSDHAAVQRLIAAAFRTEALSDNTEHELVARLRNAPDFVPELSLVATSEGTIIGHILLSKIVVRSAVADHPALALAPLSVLPAKQGKGVGGALIKRAHEVALALGYGGIILLGHAGYYPRFGYRQLNTFGITLPFAVPAENCMAIALTPEAFAGVTGEVVYPPAFGLG